MKRRVAWAAGGVLVLGAGVLAAVLALAPGADREADEDEEGEAAWLTEEKIRWLSPDNPVREARCETALFLDAVDARPGQVVADVGAGRGFFAFRLAGRVGPSGKVYATEATTPLPAYIEAWAREHAVANVVAVKTELEDPGLPEPVDTVAMFNLHSFCEAAETRAFFRALRPSVKAGGRLVFFTDGDRENVPGQTCQMPLAGMEQALEGLFRLRNSTPFVPGCRRDPQARAAGYLAVWEPM